jgi:YVTN family beta-propeller protein
MVDVVAQSAIHRTHAPQPAQNMSAAYRLARTRYATYIGRVGALAVALGIGTAVATSPGVAWATPDGDSSTTSDSSATSTGDADTSDTTSTADSSLSSPPSSTVSDSNTATGTETTTPTGTTTQTSPSQTTVTTTTGPEVTFSSSGGATTSDDTTETDSTTASAPPPEVPESAVSTQDAQRLQVDATIANPVERQLDSDGQSTLPTPRRFTSSPESELTPVTEPVPLTTASEDSAMSARFAVVATDLQRDAAPTTALSTASQQTFSPPAADPVTSLLAIPGTLISLATGLLAPFLAPGPAVPAEPPMLWAVLAWVRRQFTKDFANYTSVPNPLQTTKVEPVVEEVNAIAAAEVVAAAGLSPEFERTTVVSGLASPVDFEFLPDGRILIAEKNGAIKVFHSDHVHTAITLAVATDGERGIGGIAVDPNFGSNGYIYVSYTTAANRDRLSRFTLSGDTVVAGSERMFMEGPQPAGNLHHAGELTFGPDGKLYWAMGDNTINTNSQDLSNIYGKILRLNPVDGSAPADNPFFNTPGAVKQIYAYGFRNPFRFAFAPTGQLLVGDVGEGTWEELNLVTAGANYGWPTSEGPCTGCAFVNPIYAWQHTPPGSGASIQSVFVSNAQTFGGTYQGKVLVADGTQGWIKELTFDPEFESLISERMFDDQASNTVKLLQGPDGAIYHLTIFPNGQITRIAPAGGNRAPSAVITASPSFGYRPLTVNFSSANSSDPDGQTLSYAWNFGDPTRTDDVSTSPNPTWTYTANGSYVATLTVSDGQKTGQVTKTIVVGSTPPIAQIQQVTTPRGDMTYHAGDTITFSALTGPTVDPDQGALPNSAYHWTVNMHHNIHFHPFAEIDGPVGSITIPRTADQLDTTWYRITLTVTDGSGLSSTQFVDVNPRTVQLNFNATNPDATFTIDGIPFKGSHTETAVIGVQRVLSAPSPQFVNGAQLAFLNWSDGGAQTHTITTPATATAYTATYDAAPVVSSSAQTGFGPMGVAVSEMKTYVANRDSNTVSVIDRANPSATPVTINVVATPTAIALGPAGSNRAYVAGNNAVSVINTSTNQVIATVNTNGGQSYGVAVSPNGQRLYVGMTGNNRVAVIDISAATPTLITTVAVGTTPGGLAVSADGSRVYVANFGSNSVSVINTATNTTVGSAISVGANPAFVAVGPNGQVYVSNHSSGSVSVINTIPATPTVSTISVGAQPFGLAISPDLSRVYVVNGNDTVSIINTATNTVISTVTIDTQPENQWHSVAVSPDGRQIYVSDLADRTIRIVTISGDGISPL